MFELLGRYVPIDFAVAIFMIHCGESIECLDRDIASEVGISMTSK